MKPHIVTEDMRLRGPGRAGAGGKAVSAPGWRRLPAGGPGQRLRPPDLQHLPGPGRRDHVQLLRLLWGGACRPGTGFLLLQHPRVHRWGSGSTLLPSGPGSLPLLHPSDLCGRPGGLDRPPSGPPPLCWGGAPAAGVERGDHDRSGCGCRGSGTPGRTAAGGLRQRDHGGGPGLAAAGAGAVHHALPVF